MLSFTLTYIVVPSVCSAVGGEPVVGLSAAVVVEAEFVEHEVGFESLPLPHDG